MTVIVGTATYLGLQEFNGGIEPINSPGEGQVYGSTIPAGGTNSIAIGPSANAEYNPFLPATNGNIAIGGARARHGGQNNIVIGTDAEAGQDTAVVKSTGTIQVVAGSNLLDTDNFVLNDGENPAVTFQYDSDNSIIKTPTLRSISYTSGDSQSTVLSSTMNAIQEVINLGNLFFELVYGSPAFTINHLYGGSGGNIGIINNVVDAGFIVTGMAGGVDFTDFADNAVVIGNSSSVQSNNAIAIGDSAEVKSNSTEGIAIGLRATVWNNCGNGIAIGEDAKVGASATGLSSDSIAIGRGASIGDNSNSTILIGPALTANDFYICAIGHNISVLSSNSVIIGDGCSIGTSAIGGVVFGVSSSIGNDAQEAIAIGSNAVVAAAADNGIAIGRHTSVNTANGIAIGNLASSIGIRSFALGLSSNASGSDTVAIGYNTSAIGDYSVASGNSSNAFSDYTVVIGNNSYAFGINSIAIGRGASASNESSLAIGSLSYVSGYNSIAIGYGSYAPQNISIALGSGAHVSEIAGIAIGYQASASGINTIAIGREASAIADHSIVFGSNNAYLNEVNFHQGANEQQTLIKTATIELSDLSVSATATNLIPAGAVVLGVTTIVTLAITGANTYDVGDGVDQDRWGATIAGTLGTISDNTDWTDNSIINFSTSNDIILTGDIAFTGGAVRITVHYISSVAPTS